MLIAKGLTTTGTGSVVAESIEDKVSVIVGGSKQRSLPDESTPAFTNALLPDSSEYEEPN